MSGIFGRFLPNLFGTAQKLSSALTGVGLGAEAMPSMVIQARNRIRCNFPRAKDNKRVRVHGFDTRMSTYNGRKIIMRRILKGKFVLAH